jgi:hypothetical protein
MPDADLELRRLKEAERSAHNRFLRLSQPAVVVDLAVVRAAKSIWTEAAAAVLAYQRK